MAVEVHRAAIVGAGAAGLTAFVALRYRGLPAPDIAVFDPRGRPLGSWEESTAAIAQMSMRSESEGHFFATEFPGFALLDSLHRGSLWPLVRSTFNRYHPTLGTVLLHGRALARHYDLEGHTRQVAIARIRKVEGPEPHFALYDEGGNLRGRARHVLLALGHGPFRWPDACGDAAERAALGGLLFHAYEAKPYTGRPSVVVGSGMAAATEWVNILRAGGSVVAVRRSPRLVEQQLSAPRCIFAGPWLDRYHALSPEERAATLEVLARGTFPRRRSWRKLLDEAARSGRLEHRLGEVVGVRRDPGGRAAVEFAPAGTGETEILTADMVVAATGFLSGWQQHAVLRGLADDYRLATHGPHLILDDDSTVPGMVGNGWSLALSGPVARWAYPAADSFAGMKYASRRFAEHVMGRQLFGLKRLGAWCGMVRGGWPYGGGGKEEYNGREPCATP